MFYPPRIKAHVFFFSSGVTEIQGFFFYYKKKVKFFFTLNFILFGSSFLKDTLIIEDFKSILFRSGKVPEYKGIAGPRKNGREVAKTTVLLTEKNRKNTSENSERKFREAARISKASFRTNKP